MSSKKPLRLDYRQKRKAISPDRRAAAEESGTKELLDILSSYNHVLSYASFDDEFSTTQINEKLVLQKKLILPRICGEGLQLYKVQDLKDLEIDKHGIAEPKDIFLNKIALEMIDICLIPAIVFDTNMHRIGYGKGFYDRLLEKFSSSCLTIGIGFKEQLYKAPFIVDPHDVQLHKVMLF